jgi:hypothetical protein
LSKYLVSVVETYRVDTEDEVERFIEENKSKAKNEGYILKTCSYSLKEKKAKGEVIDSAFLVKITKDYNSFWEV